MPETIVLKRKDEKKKGYSLTIPDSPGPGPGFVLRERNTLKEPIGVDRALLF